MNNNTKCTAILLCAGEGKRVGLQKNKLLYKIADLPLFLKPLNVFLSHELIEKIIVVASEVDIEEMKECVKHLQDVKKVTFCLGGAQRTNSVENALRLVESSLVIIHDGARIYITKEIISDAIKIANEKGASSAFVSPTDTIACFKEDEIKEVLKRDSLASIQTPQAFKTPLIKKAYSKIQEGDSFSDDAGVYMKYIGPVFLSKGDYHNIKITTTNDIERILPLDYKVGTGFDTHKFTEGRDLVLGGVVIPYEKGLLAHSDGDVLTHAIMDAILNAIDERDIGNQFPDSDMKYKDIDSTILLKEVVKLMQSKNYSIHNISACIIAEEPKLYKIIPTIEENLSKLLNVDKTQITLSASTMEKLGIIGTKKGMSTQCTCLVKKFL